MRILFTLLCAAFLVSVAGCSKPKEGDNYQDVRADDSAMNAAIAEAKSTSTNFIRAFHDQKLGTRDYDVKKPYPTPSGGVEHMWITVTGETNGVITGVVANEAEETREVKMGQTVTFYISDISDWKYVAGKKLIGGYTIRYFYDRMSPKQREQFVSEAGFEP